MKHNSILRRVQVVVAATLLLAGCGRTPDEPIYTVPIDVPERTELQYVLVKLIDSGLTRLHGVAVGRDGRIYAVGVGGVNVCDADGKLIANWKKAEEFRCVATADDGTIYLGSQGRIIGLDGSGKEVGSWEMPRTGSDKPARITSVAVRGIELLAADADSRCVRRFTVDGDFSNDIGRADPESGSLGLIVPSPYLDCAITSEGKVVVTNPGKRRIETYTLSGKLESFWGKSGMDADRFCGCCNPTDLALTGNGHVVTAEKGIFRVKIYDKTGRMLAFIGQEFFSRKVAGMDLATDGKGRIYVADPGDGKIRIFALKQLKQRSEGLK